MFKSIIIIAILFVQSAVSIKTPQEKGYVNEPRCNLTTNTGLRYFITFENDLTKFIECVAKNWGIEQFCAEGTYFDSRLVSCMVSEDSKIKYDTVVVYHKSRFFHKREASTDNSNSTVSNNSISNNNVSDVTNETIYYTAKRMVVDEAIIDPIHQTNDAINNVSAEIENSTNTSTLNKREWLNNVMIVENETIEINMSVTAAPNITAPVCQNSTDLVNDINNGPVDVTIVRNCSIAILENQTTVTMIANEISNSTGSNLKNWVSFLNIQNKRDTEIVENYQNYSIIHNNTNDMQPQNISQYEGNVTIINNLSNQDSTVLSNNNSTDTRIISKRDVSLVVNVQNETFALNLTNGNATEQSSISFPDLSNSSVVISWNKRQNGDQQNDVTTEVSNTNSSDFSSQIDDLVNSLLCKINVSDYELTNNNPDPLNQASLEYKKNCVNGTLVDSDINTFNFNETEKSDIKRDINNFFDQINNLTNLINKTIHDTNQSTLSLNLTNITLITTRRDVYDALDLLKFSKCCKQCLNGVCNTFSKEAECICWPNYTGHLCDAQKNETEKSYLKILNGSLKIQDLTAANYTANYLFLWSEVVETLWSEINPEHSFVRNFNFSSNSNQTYVELGTSYQKFYLYSKLAARSIKSKILLFEKVLAKLVENSNQNETEITKFLQYLKTTQRATGTFSSEDFKSQIVKELNATEKVAFKLYKCLKRFISKNNSSEIGIFLNAFNSSQMVESIKGSVVHSWELTVDYGFMYLTIELSNSTSDYVAPGDKRTYLTDAQLVRTQRSLVNKNFNFKLLNSIIKH